MSGIRAFIFGFGARRAAMGLALTTTVAVPAAGQNIDRVRTLYVAAAYEEALAAMPPPDAEAPVRPDLEQYRALCLLALGREKDAEAAVERIVRDQPMFLPPAADTSPRMQAIFAGVRSRVLPDAARRAYLDAKAAYEAKDREGARAAFQRTIDLVDSLPDADKSRLADLRLLAAEFLELTTVRAALVPVPELPRAAPAEPGAGKYVPPAAIVETLPPWYRPTPWQCGRSMSAFCGS